MADKDREKAARLAIALRENLKRRKARERAIETPAPPLRAPLDDVTK